MTEVGADCRFAPFVSIGTEPQDVGYKGDATEVQIGDGNVFKEFITVNRGTVKGGGVTRIGDRNFLMAYTHIGHDCQVGNEIIFTNNATLAGHVIVRDYRHSLRLHGRPSVLPDRPVRLHRRIHGRHPGRAALLQGRRHAPRPDLRA